MKCETVDLHDDPLRPPAEVDLEAADTSVDLRLRQPSSAYQREEDFFCLGTGLCGQAVAERKLAGPGRPATVMVDEHHGPDGCKRRQPAGDRLIEGALELAHCEVVGDVEQGARRRSDWNPVIGASITRV